MDERALAERLMSYDTSTPDGVRNAASFVQGWLGSHEIDHQVRDFDGLPVILATVGPPVGPTVVLHGHIDVVPAHSAQFVRLALSIDAGAPVERPAIVACRYAVVCR